MRQVILFREWERSASYIRQAISCQALLAGHFGQGEDGGLAAVHIATVV